MLVLGVGTGEGGALNRFGAQVVQRLHAAFPSRPVQHVQVPLVHVTRHEQVQRLGLTDFRRAVGGQFDQPALVQFEGGLEHALLVFGQEVEVLDRAFVFEDRVPDGVGVLALFFEQALQIGVLDRERARQGLVGVDIGRDRLDTCRGAAADDRDRRGRRDRHLVRETLHHAAIGRVRAGALFFGQQFGSLVGFAAQVFEQAHVPRLGHGGFKRHALRLQEGVEAHQAQTDRALAGGRIDSLRHGRGGAVDEVLQHVVEEAHHVLDEARLFAPLEEGLGVHRRQAAHGGALFAKVVLAGGQHDFGAQVRLLDLEAQLLLVLGQLAVHRVREDQIGFARLHADFEDLGPQAARIDSLAHFVVLGRAQVERLAVAHRFHELVGDVDAVVQVQRLAVEVTRRLADFEELFDLRMVHVQIDGGRAATQRALRNGQRQRVHHTDEGDDARRLAGTLDLFTDRADAAPIGADAAAVGGQLHVFVPDVLDTIEAVVDRVQEAGDRQAAIRAAVRQNRRGGHEPQLRHIVINALGMVGVVSEGGRDAGEHVLIGLARQQITVFEGLFAEICQQIVTAAI